MRLELNIKLLMIIDDFLDFTKVFVDLLAGYICWLETYKGHCPMNWSVCTSESTCPEQVGFNFQGASSKRKREKLLMAEKGLKEKDLNKKII